MELVRVWFAAAWENSPISTFFRPCSRRDRQNFDAAGNSASTGGRFAARNTLDGESKGIAGDGGENSNDCNDVVRGVLILLPVAGGLCAWMGWLSHKAWMHYSLRNRANPPGASAEKK
jgi:hypothetical protein